MSSRDEIRAMLDAARQKARQDKDSAHEVAIRYQSLDTQVKSVRESIERSDRQVAQLQERRESLSRTLKESEDPLPGLQEELDQQLKLRLEAEGELSSARELVTEVEQPLLGLAARARPRTPGGTGKQQARRRDRHHQDRDPCLETVLSRIMIGAGTPPIAGWTVQSHRNARYRNRGQK